MEAGTCPLLDVHTARTAVRKTKSILPCDCTRTMQIQYPVFSHFLWSEFPHVKEEDFWGQMSTAVFSHELRKKSSLRHNDACSCYCAHLSTATRRLPPSPWSTGVSTASGYPAARTHQTWFLQHGSNCLVSILHPPISKLSSRSSKIHLPQ